MSMSNVSVVIEPARKPAAKDDDALVIDMVNTKTAARREEAKRIADKVYRDLAPQKDTYNRRKTNLKRFVAAAARAVIGCVFLGAISRGLIGPGFGIALAVACFIWAVHTFRR